MGDDQRGDSGEAREPSEPGPPTETLVPRGFARARRSLALERGSSVGRYLVLERIGAGGMGIVFAGYDPELDRKVALKLLHPEKTGSLGAVGGEARLLREAQAIARLSHPNVVAVYDVGTFADEVFVAMELVAGRTLRAWAAAGKRSWREILAVFLAAGEGLSAAHAAGLAHRDFKPDNVLIGDDGGVKVVDFGLARALAGRERESSGEESSGSVLLNRGEKGEQGEQVERVTEWGLAAGTPAYMAPEQRRGLPADARSDQYSFCVALWEALYGALPAVTSRAAEAEHAGQPVKEGSAGGKGERQGTVPARLRLILARGLAVAPEARYPALSYLLRALAHDPAARRRRWALAAGLALAGGLLFAGLGYLQAGRAQLCRGGEAEIARVWNPERGAALRAAFAATGLAYAPESAALVGAALDRYAREWASGARRACEATRLRGAESEEMLDRRRLCLDQRRDELDALVQLFGQADARTVEKAVDAARGLGDLHACVDSASLAELVPLPHDAALRFRVAQAQARLARVKALQDSGKPRQALALAEQVAREVDGLPYRPLQAAASYRLADCRENSGDFKVAEEDLYRALRWAEEGRDDLRKAQAWRKLAYTVGYRLGRPEEAQRMVGAARAALLRAGGNVRLEVEILSSEGALFQTFGRLAEAEAAYLRQLALARRLGEGEDYTALLNLAAIIQARGETERAEPGLRAGLKAAERSLGPSHPTVAAAHFNLGVALADLGRFAESDAELTTSLRLRESLFGRDNADVAETLGGLGANWTRRGDARRGLPFLARADEVYSRVAPDSVNAILARQNLGDAHRMLGRWDEAERELRSALASFEKRIGGESAYAALPLLTLGQVAIERGRPARALPLLDRAEAILLQEESLQALLGAVRFRRAQALWDVGEDRPRALRLAREARQVLVAAGPPAREDLAAAEAWLAAHSRRSGTIDG